MSALFSELPIWQQLTLVVFGLGTFHYVGAVVFLSIGYVLLRRADKPQNNTFTVIIAAHNEEHTIGACLQSVLAQTISPERFEVIVANDRSTDRTAEVVEGFQIIHEKLRLITIQTTPGGVSPKKYALSCAIEEASNPIIVFTDADCTVPPTWLETIDRRFEPDVGIVQGITTYRKPDRMNPHFFGLQAIDFLSHGIVSATAIGAGMPINSNANNFAFRFEVFRSLGGYEGVQNVISGDDDLLLQKVWRSGRWRIRYMADPEGAVETLPTRTVLGVFEQRKRWGSKTVHYNALQVFFLSGIFLFYVSILASFILSFVEPGFAVRGAIMLAVKFAGEVALMVPGVIIFRKKDLLPYLAPASLLQLPITILAVLLGVFGNFSWKGQAFRRKAGA